MLKLKKYFNNPSKYNFIPIQPLAYHLLKKIRERELEIKLLGDNEN